MGEPKAVLRRSWGGLGVVLAGLGAILDPSWVILAGLGVILGRLGRRTTLIFLLFFNYFCNDMSNFAMSMVILAGPEAFLEPLGASLERSWDFWEIFGAPRELRDALAGSRNQRRGTPPSLSY